MSVDSIPVAHTPPGGWNGDFPEPVLADCTDPIIDGAPDMDGMWQVVEVLVDNEPTPITVVATFEEGVHVLRPVGLPIEVKRWLDGADLMWQYIGFTCRLVRVGSTDITPG